MLSAHKVRSLRERLLSVQVWSDGAAVPLTPGVRDYLGFHASRYAFTRRAILSEVRGDERVLEIGPSPWLAATILRERPRLRWESVTGGYPLGAAEPLERRAEAVEVELGGQRFAWTSQRGVNVEVDPLPFPDERFDLVIFLEVIEHLIHDPVWALREIARVLAPGGLLVLSTDNANNFVKLLKLLTRRSIYHPLPVRSFGERHHREYLSHELVDLLEGVGYRDLRVETFNHLPFLPEDDRAKSLAYRCGNALTTLPPLRHLRRHVLVLARKGAARDYRPGWLFFSE